MSRTSFKAFCVEFYADHVGKTGPEVYAAFEESGLLRELDLDCEDLHGMGMAALMQLFGPWLGKGRVFSLLFPSLHRTRFLC